MTTETIIKEIVYVTAGDYDCYVTVDGQREYIGSAPSYHDGELKCDNYAYHYYADNHTPEVAAAIAVGMSEATPHIHHRLVDGQFTTKGVPRCKRCIAEYQAQLDALPAHRSVTVGYDGEQCDLVSIAAQVLLPLAHLRPALNKEGTYLTLGTIEQIPVLPNDHAIACNLIDRLNEVAAQLPAWPTSISAWLHTDSEVYQVARNKK